MAGELQEEVTCPICIDILQEPVTIDCGHNFCLQCISEVGKGADSLLCPLCKVSVDRSTFRPNKLLANLAEKIQALETKEVELRCQRHREKLHYFCENDGELLCTVCRDSKKHKSHSLSPIEEVMEKYQQKIQSQVHFLGQKEKEILQETAEGESMIRIFRAWVVIERLRILDEFQLLRQSLEVEERFLLARLGWLAQEGVKQMKSFARDTQEQLSSLRELNESLKAKLKMTSRQLLQDVKGTLSRCQGFQFVSPTPVPGNLAENISEAKSRRVQLLRSLTEFKDRLQADGKKDKSRFLDSLKEEDKESWSLFEKNTAESPTSAPSASFLQGSRASYGELPEDGDHLHPEETPEDIKMTFAPVTLDESSAHPDLILSQDLKTVKMDERIEHEDDPDRKVDPLRFYPLFCVLGCPAISSGRRIWEVELQMYLRFFRRRCCVVGVASELVPRQGPLEVKPLNGFWALQVCPSQCQPLTDSRTQETLQVSVRKVGIYVSYDCGDIVFYDTTTSKHIYTFHASFTGKLFPFFRLHGPCNQITLVP